MVAEPTQRHWALVRQPHATQLAPSGIPFSPREVNTLGIVGIGHVGMRARSCRTVASRGPGWTLRFKIDQTLQAEEKTKMR